MRTLLLRVTLLKSPVPQLLGFRRTNRTVSSLVTTTARTIESINRSDIAIAKYVTELKERQAAKLEELKSEGQQLGITEEYLDRIEREWLGLF